MVRYSAAKNSFPLITESGATLTEAEFTEALLDASGHKFLLADEFADRIITKKGTVTPEQKRFVTQAVRKW